MSSKLFDYASGHSQVFDQNGAYLPGRLPKTGYQVVETFQTDATKPVEYGEVVKISATDAKKVVPIEAGDAAADVYGVVVRTYNQISNATYASGVNQFVYQPAPGQAVSVMRKGWIAIPVQKGTPAVGTTLTVRIALATPDTGLPIGGIEAGDAVALETVAVTGMRFVSGPGFPMKSVVVENVGNGTGQTAIIAIDFAL